MKSVLRGIFLTSQNPEATARFYQMAAGLDLERVGNPGTYQYWKIDSAQMQLAIHDAKAFAPYCYPPLSESNLTHLYFKIENQSSFLEHIARLNLAPFAIDEVVVTVVDPDGRKVMFGTA